MSAFPLDPHAGNLSMLELFRLEAENQVAVLTSGLLDLERGGATPETFEALMRAAHSVKGAARIANLEPIVRVAHKLEDCFVAAQHQRIRFRPADMDLLFQGVDLLNQLAKHTETSLAEWQQSHVAELKQLLDSMAAMVADRAPSRLEPSPPVARPTAPALVPEAMPPGKPPPEDLRKADTPERVLRLTAENLNRLLGLAGESLVESRWLRPFADSLQRLKRQQMDLREQLQRLQQCLEDEYASERSQTYAGELARALAECQQLLAERVQDLDSYERRSGHLSQRLYLEVLRTRMRPFSDGVRRFPRMVRDLARSLEKQVKLEIAGETTQVDRDILERLETPLAHLLRNAVDHGCELPQERRKAGKPLECTLRLEARHSAGVLLVTVTDDGRGIDPDQVRSAAVRKQVVGATVADKMSEAELLTLLFLPGFTLKDMVTEISGRGFGLDVVQNMVKGLRGSIRLSNQPGRGLRVQLQLPLTLSVLRALLVEIAGEPYAIPLSQIARTLKLSRASVQSLEGRHHFMYGDQQIGLLTAHEVLERGSPKTADHELPVVVLGDRSTHYGVVVDRFLGERELVVQPLDPRLGKVRDISAAALMEDGSPVLILDVEEMLRSIEQGVASGALGTMSVPSLPPPALRPKRELAVDDSLTVRELERKLLVSRGYQAEVAADGLDAWNALRGGEFDLVITDIDMPHLDGIELATRIKKDPRLKSLPVLIVSYKDADQDRVRGLQAGVDFYLTKGNFQEETLLQAVTDLIGAPGK